MISILEESGSSIDPNIGPIIIGILGLIATCNLFVFPVPILGTGF